MLTPSAPPTFELTFAPLESPAFSGEIALIPWDTALLGFSVAELRSLVLHEEYPFTGFMSDLPTILNRREIELCIARIPTGSHNLHFALQQSGFLHIESSLELRHGRLSDFKGRFKNIPIRLATEQDLEPLTAIAADSFVHERYTADLRIPRSKAGSRYKHWITHALTSQLASREFSEASLSNGSKEVMVVEAQGEVVGFMIGRRVRSPLDSSTVSDEVHFELGAIKSTYQNTALGPCFFSSLLDHFREVGCVAAVTRVSINNLAVLRLWLSLGCQITQATDILDWKKG